MANNTVSVVIAYIGKKFLSILWVPDNQLVVEPSAPFSGRFEIWN